MSETLTSINNHFASIVDSITGLSTSNYDFGFKSEANEANRSYPLFRYVNPSQGFTSTLSSQDINKGKANEKHQVVIEVSAPESLAAISALSSLQAKLDYLMALYMEFMYRAFSNEYKTRYDLVGNLDDIQIEKLHKQDNDQNIKIRARFEMRVFTGCSDYSSTSTCAAASVTNANDGSLLGTIASNASATLRSFMDDESGAHLAADLRAVSRMDDVIAQQTAAEINASATQSARNINKIYPPNRKLSTFYILNVNNDFGGSGRFTDENGRYYADPINGLDKRDANGTSYSGAIFQSDYLIDHEKGYGWKIVPVGIGQLQSVGITACNDLVLTVGANTYSDFFNGEIEELQELRNAYGTNIYPFRHWNSYAIAWLNSSTQRRDFTARHFCSHTQHFYIDEFTSSTFNGGACLPCRLHYT